MMYLYSLNITELDSNGDSCNGQLQRVAAFLETQNGCGGSSSDEAGHNSAAERVAAENTDYI